MEQFWLCDYKYLYKNDAFMKIIPSSTNTKAENYNAMTRLLIIIMTISLLLGFLIISIICLFLILFLAYYYEHGQKENFQTSSAPTAYHKKNKKNKKKFDSIPLINIANDIDTNFCPVASNSYDEEIVADDNAPIILDPRMFTSVDINTREENPLIEQSPEDQQHFAHWLFNNTSPSAPLY